MKTSGVHGKKNGSEKLTNHMIHIQPFTHFVDENEGLHTLMPKDWQTALEKATCQLNKKLVELGHVEEGSQELIELNLMTNTQIQKVNCIMRGKDVPTDVISLRLGDEDGTDTEGSVENEPFGEVYISIEKCDEQARELNQDFEEELAFLLVHGVLHIFGYDHLTAGEEAEMMGLAYEVLGRGKYSG